MSMHFTGSSAQNLLNRITNATQEASVIVQKVFVESFPNCYSLLELDLFIWYIILIGKYFNVQTDVTQMSSAIS